MEIFRLSSFSQVLWKSFLVEALGKKDKSGSVQWNLVIKRLDITKPSYNKVILLVPTLYISLLFYPDIT